MKPGTVIIAALMLLGIGTTSTMAWDEYPRFKVFGGLSYVAPLGEDDVTIDNIEDSVEESNEVGWTIGLESRFNKIIGLELDYVNATNDVEFGGQVIGDVHMQPLSATVNFHVIPTKVVDLYLGPTVSYFIWGDVDLGSTGKFKTDNDVAWGASLGLEIGIGKTFAIMGGLRWMNADIEPEGIEKIGVDPLFGRLGVALRF